MAGSLSIYLCFFLERIILTVIKKTQSGISVIEVLL